MTLILLILLIDQLDPAIAFLLMGTVFLVMSVAGWYIGEAIVLLRAKMRKAG